VKEKFKDFTNFEEMVLLKNKRERGNSSHWEYGDTSSIKNCKKRQF